MLRKAIFTAATARAVFVTVSTVSTDLSAAGRFGGFQNHQAGRVIAGLPHRPAGAGGLVRQTGGDVRCWSAEWRRRGAEGRQVCDARLRDDAGRPTAPAAFRVLWACRAAQSTASGAECA